MSTAVQQDEQTRMMTIRMKPSVWRALKIRAATNGRTMSAELEAAIRKYLIHYKEKTQ